MATWTDTTTIKAGVTNGKPGTGTGGTGDQLADNLQYLYDRINQVGLNTASGIHDDFTEDVLDDAAQSPYTWETQIDGAETLALDGAPDHYLHFTCSGVNKTVIAASEYKMRFDLDRDHTLYMEVRHKSSNSDAASTWLVGFQDESIAIAGDAVITTQTNMIAFRQDAVAQKYDAICARSAGSGTLVVANSQGNAANWTVLRIEITFAGATKKVEFFIDGTSVGSTTDTNYITLVKLRPVIGFYGGGGARNHFIDYVDADWTVRPLST